MKKLSEMVRTIYTISRILPNYEIRVNNNLYYRFNLSGTFFDYKFYCNKKLNNDFVDDTYQKKKMIVDIDIAKIYLSIKYYLKNDIFLIGEKIVTIQTLSRKVRNWKRKSFQTTSTFSTKGAESFQKGVIYPA